MGDPFPRAWVVHAIEVIPDEEDTLARLSAEDFDVRRAAVVAEPLDIPLGGTPDGSTAQVTSFGPNQITVEVETDAVGLLVLSEVYYPGWRASVDDMPARLIRANGLLRGIPVPEGQHTVQVWYAPPTARLGLVISALALAFIAGVELWRVIKRA